MVPETLRRRKAEEQSSTVAERGQAGEAGGIEELALCSLGDWGPGTLFTRFWRLDLDAEDQKGVFPV